MLSNYHSSTKLNEQSVYFLVFWGADAKTAAKILMDIVVNTLGFIFVHHQHLIIRGPLFSDLPCVTLNLSPPLLTTSQISQYEPSLNCDTG